MSSRVLNRPSQKVLVAIDESANAEQAFIFYMSNLHRPGNEVIFAHSAEPPVVSMGLGGHGYGFVSGALYEDMMSQRRAEVKKLRNHYAAWATSQDVNYKFTAVEFGGHPGEAIVSLAKKSDCRVIVMGSRGLGRVRRTVLGSVSDYVVHHAHCPVMVCHDQKWD